MSFVPKINDGVRFGFTRWRDETEGSPFEYVVLGVWAQNEKNGVPTNTRGSLGMVLLQPEWFEELEDRVGEIPHISATGQNQSRAEVKEKLEALIMQSPYIVRRGTKSITSQCTGSNPIS